MLLIQQSSKQEMISGPFLRSRPRSAACAFEASWPRPPVSGKNSRRVPVQAFRLNGIARGFQTSGAVGLWRGTHINILLMLVARCEGKLSIEYCIQFCGRSGSCIFVSPPHCAPCLLSFRLVFGTPPIRAECSLLRLPLAHLPRRNSCGPAQHH